jgi:deoxyadenosine/deoxycytidine kinase
MTNDEVDVDSAIRFSLATRRQKMLKDYVERGRQLEQLCDDQLREYFVSGFKLYSSNPDNHSHKTMFNYAWAEFELRKHDPPFELVTAEVKTLTQKAAACLRATPRESQSEICEEFIREFLEAQARKN